MEQIFDTLLIKNKIFSKTTQLIFRDSHMRLHLIKYFSEVDA
jgi:hypothetical protein